MIIVMIVHHLVIIMVVVMMVVHHVTVIMIVMTMNGNGFDVFSCRQQLNRTHCPLVPLSVTTNNQSLHNITE